MMLVTGIGLLSAAIPIPAARAYPSRGEASAGRGPLPAAPPGTAAGGFLFSDDFDGPAGCDDRAGGAPVCTAAPGGAGSRGLTFAFEVSASDSSPG